MSELEDQNRENSDDVKAARLHQAAQQLLDACYVAVSRLEVCDYHGDEDEFIEILQSAIVAATGERYE